MQLLSRMKCLLYMHQIDLSPKVLVRLGSLDLEEVRVTGVLDGHDTDAEETTGSGAEVDVGALVVVDRGLGTEGCQRSSK